MVPSPIGLHACNRPRRDCLLLYASSLRFFFFSIFLLFSPLCCPGGFSKTISFVVLFGWLDLDQPCSKSNFKLQLQFLRQFLVIFSEIISKTLMYSNVV
uniref:Protein NEF1 n=1 Tax=Rhizophora mucronata TaxID=61149 RepID=A0A2P2NFE6_RHIMU